MQLIRFGPFGQEKPGVLDAAGHRRDASGFATDWDSDFWRDASRVMSQIQDNLLSLPQVEENERWGAPVPRPGKIICVGLNYADHAREANMKLPDEPTLFMKAANTIVGPFDNIVIPRGSKKTDWEVELGVIISVEARYLESPEQAKEYIGGYAVSHDVSERAFQLEGSGQWTKGKSCDSFNPLGPTLVTPDDIPNIENVALGLKVNGETMQSSRTSQMVWGPAYLVYYISQFMTLEPGDLISTGTPFGVGLGLDPPRYLKPGDVVELEIEGLSSQRQVCVSA